jgi:hypothetical protein
MKEIWKDIAGFEGLYQVSNLGNVKRLISERVFEERPIGRTKDKYGYIKRVLSKEGKIYFFTEHRLVAMTFIDNPLNKKTVNHKNGIKTDNSVENLEWCTNKENMKHAIETGLKDQKGIKHHKCKLTEEQVLEIRKIGFSETRMSLSKKYGISRTNVLGIIRRKFWKHI